jgi:IclR family transcriptional regulator, acetate operon repressor
MRKIGTQSVDRALNLLSIIIADQGQSSIAELGRSIALPTATTYRLVSAFVRDDFLIAVGRGRHVAGPKLADLASKTSLHPALIALGQPIVKRLAKATGCVAHLGVLEKDMVTYLLKAGPSSLAIFTEQGTQLEAYCSGIGKILLASLPSDELATYLKAGPFIPLTPHTIIDPKILADQLVMIEQQGFARDVEEVANGLFCLAVAIHNPAGAAIAALSVSRNQKHGDEASIVESLRQSAKEIEDKIFRAAKRA